MSERREAAGNSPYSNLGFGDRQVQSVNHPSSILISTARTSLEYSKSP